MTTILNYFQKKTTFPITVNNKTNAGFCWKKIYVNQKHDNDKNILEQGFYTGSFFYKP